MATIAAQDERLQAYAAYLQGEGYKPIVAEGMVSFKAEGRTYFVLVDADDSGYFQLVYPNFWTIESDVERRQALRCANEITRSFKVAKVYLRADEGDVWAAIELFLAHPKDFELIFPRALRALQGAGREFVEKMKQ
jgi:hypothetical protein